MSFTVKSMDQVEIGDVVADAGNSDFDSDDFESTADWFRIDDIDFKRSDDGTALFKVLYFHQDWAATIEVSLYDLVAVHDNPHDFIDND